MYKIFKIIAVSIALTGFASAAHAASYTATPVYTAQTQAQHTQATRKSTRIVKRVEHKYVASKAAHDKHLVRLNTGAEAYGRVVVPTQTTAKTPNLYRP